MSVTLHLSSVKILRTGTDGGHLYIQGRGNLPTYGECDVYAYFHNKEEERLFESEFSNQSVIVEADGIEFIHGIGGSIRKIICWRFT